MKKRLGIYIHIPFCASKCSYCDFYSLAGCEHMMPDYQDALLAHIEESSNAIKNYEVDTVYFGGGTPSLLTPAQAERLIRAAEPVPGAEITLEANPETVTEESLRGFRAAGVNRISFGVQSARDTQLRTLGRPHSAKQARAAFAAARRAGRPLYCPLYHVQPLCKARPTLRIALQTLANILLIVDSCKTFCLQR